MEEELKKLWERLTSLEKAHADLKNKLAFHGIVVVQDVPAEPETAPAE